MAPPVHEDYETCPEPQSKLEGGGFQNLEPRNPRLSPLSGRPHQRAHGTNYSALAGDQDRVSVPQELHLKDPGPQGKTHKAQVRGPRWKGSGTHLHKRGQVFIFPLGLGLAYLLAFRSACGSGRASRECHVRYRDKGTQEQQGRGRASPSTWQGDLEPGAGRTAGPGSQLTRTLRPRTGDPGRAETLSAATLRRKGDCWGCSQN